MENPLGGGGWDDDTLLYRYIPYIYVHTRSNVAALMSNPKSICNNSSETKKTKKSSPLDMAITQSTLQPCRSLSAYGKYSSRWMGPFSK